MCMSLLEKYGLCLWFDLRNRRSRSRRGRILGEYNGGWVLLWILLLVIGRFSRLSGHPDPWREVYGFLQADGGGASRGLCGWRVRRRWYGQGMSDRIPICLLSLFFGYGGDVGGDLIEAVVFGRVVFFKSQRLFGRNRQ